MKLAIITDEVSHDLSEAAVWMRELGVEGAELRTLWGQNISNLDADTLNKTRKAVKDYQLNVCSIASPFYKCHLYGEGGAAGMMHDAPVLSFEDQMGVLERSIQMAHEFDCPYIRIFSFWRLPEFNDKILTDIANALESPLRIAEKEGITLLMENEHACILGSAQETVQLLQKVNSPHLKAVYDTGNSFCTGETPYPDGWNAIKDWTVHIHVKDPIKTNEGYVFKIMGEGSVDHKGFFQQVKSDGYDGFISLETHAKIEGLTPSEISRRCIENMRRMME